MRNGQPVIGHIWSGDGWAGGDVWAVYNDPKTGLCFDRLICGRWVKQPATMLFPPGQDWRSIGEWTPASQGDGRKAYHEAGHAVVGRLSGFRVEYVTIATHDHESGKRWGVCQLDYQLTPANATTEQLPDLILFMMGGMVAERRYIEILRQTRPDAKDTDERTWDGDTHQIEQFLNRLSHEGKPANKNSLEERVRELVHDEGNWGWITRIAGRLANDGAIPGSVVDELRAKPSNPPTGSPDRSPIP